jgi:hypothetical protein
LDDDRIAQISPKPFRDAQRDPYDWRWWQRRRDGALRLPVAEIPG